MKLQKKILDYLKAQPDTFAIKVEVANERGCPDILCCHKGQFIAIEIKDGKDKLSSIQEEQLKRIEAASGKTIVIRNIEDVEKL